MTTETTTGEHTPATATALEPVERKLPKPPEKPGKLVVHDDSPVAHLFDTARFEQMQRVARLMAGSTLIPDHLRGIKRKGQPLVPFEPDEVLANCFLVVNQSVRWGLDPFSVAPETYVVGGKLAFQGKLIAALVNSRASLVPGTRLEYEFSGNGDGRRVTVYGTFQGDDEPSTVDLSVGQAKTANEMWKKDPDQKLIYSASVKWARRHCPEVMLGVLTDDDLDMIATRSAAAAPRERPTALEDLTRQWAETEPTPEPEPTHTEPEPPELSVEHELRIHGILVDCETITDVGDVLASEIEAHPYAEDAITAMCAVRKSQIKGSRGEKSNSK